MNILRQPWQIYGKRAQSGIQVDLHGMPLLKNFQEIINKNPRQHEPHNPFTTIISL